MSTPLAQDILLTGSCLCGKIRYEVSKIHNRMAHCHCTMCRKFHGAAFSTYTEARREHFRWVQGENNLKTYQAPNGTRRQFCEQCGSSMTFSASDADGSVIEFASATLDTPVDLHPDAHIYTESRVSWFQINDGLPEYKVGRG